MELINDCQKCTDFDAETRTILYKLFDSTESALIVTLLANMVYGLAAKLAEKCPPGMDEKAFYQNRMANQARKDFAVMILGKIYNALEPDYREKLRKTLLKSNLAINISQGGCPHEEPECSS